MSKIKIQGNASGTGVVTLIAPNTNTDKTITLPDSTATLVGSDASGNVGIGVTPESWRSDYTALQIGTTASLASEGGVTATISENSYRATDGVQKYITSSHASQLEMEGGKHTFQVVPSGIADSAISWTTAMTIDNNGQIKVGNLQDNLQSARGISCSGSGYASLRVRRGTDNGACVAFYGSSSTSTSVGYIGVTTSSTSYNTSSDYRLKENVVPMSGSIDRLKQLKPSRFNFIADADTTVDGFLAHEAGEVVPECVTGEKDAMKMEDYEVTPAVMDGETVITEAVMGEREVPDMQGIDQSKLVPLLVGAIQELTARLEALEAN